MIAVGLIRKCMFSLAFIGVLVVVGASSAYAASPWWHLTADARPTTLQPGFAKNEVQEIAVAPRPGGTGTEAAFEVSVNHVSLGIFGTEPYAKEDGFPEPTAANLQSALEGVYGKDNVVVSGGPAGTAPLLVTSVNEGGGQTVAPIEVENLGAGTPKATVLSKGRPDGQIVLMASNLGDADANGAITPVTIVDSLPSGLRATAIEGFREKGFNKTARIPATCSLKPLNCSFTGVVPPYEQVEVRISVALKAGAQSGEINEATVSGGGALAATASHPVAVGDTPVPFGVSNYEMSAENEGGSPDTQAGSHPFQLTTTLLFNQNFNPEDPPGLAKDLHFKLPPGLIGNPSPFPQCTDAQFFSVSRLATFVNDCPNNTTLGVSVVTIQIPGFTDTATSVAVPLFNLKPKIGEPARFGFEAYGVPVILDTSVRTGGDYGVTVSVSNITQTATFLGSRVTFWGVPGDPRHDNARGWSCIGDDEIWREEGNEGGLPACAPLGELHPPAFLSMPTSCTGPTEAPMEFASWQQEGVFGSLSPKEPLAAGDGCNRLPFSPSISVAPDGQAGSTPTGLTVGIHVPQEVSLNAGGLSEAEVKDTTVVLPAGIGLNPAAADGLQACTDVSEPGRPEGEIALNSPGAPVCPEASKVATVEIRSPLLPNPLVGEAYLAAQDANPFGSLVALYLVAQDPVSGTLVKVAGEVKPDPVTGQLVSTFKNTPQLPFEDLKLHFFGGDRAPLSTPGLCGAYTTVASIAPWSGNEPSTPSSTFEVIFGPNGTPCSSPLPFAPSLTAGTTSIQAGGFSPFTMTMSRPDGSQNLQAIKLRMPPGLLGTLATVKLCPEGQANAGTCGPESLIGHTIVSVGVGGDPYSVRGGEVFITEGYKGAPYGLSIVNPAKAGPFDLGKVIVRAKIEVDPITAVLTITTDTSGPYKIPTILDGIPLQIQHVNVAIDRHGFTFNPTNCSPQAITGSLTSDQGATQSLSVPFQITNCAVLAFKPKLTAKTAGKTSRAKGASLSVKLTYPAGPFDANIAKVKVDLPKQLPSRLTTLQKACTAATFERNPAECPSASIVGHATATTPVIPVPLTGPAYFVSHGGEAFPDLIIVLQGYGATVHLVGTTFISKAGITSSTFKQVPDVPVGTFELTLPQGKYSALAANGNLCTTTKLTMPTSFIAQNGANINTTTPIIPTGCAKHKTKKKTAKHNTNNKHKKK
jgi:hypothetical protein